MLRTPQHKTAAALWPANQIERWPIDRLVPYVLPWNGSGGSGSPRRAELVDFVLSKNLHRRQLTASQRAFTVAETQEIRSRGHGGNRRSGDKNCQGECSPCAFLRIPWAGSCPSRIA
jgi:hypothetical protein